MLNQVTLIARLVRDVELSYTPNTGTAVAKFTLAVDRMNGKNETDFIDIVAWNKTAELSAQYLSKGKLCAVVGSLRIRSYEAKDGTKRRVAEVVAESVRFLSPKSEASDDVKAMFGGTEVDSEVPF